MDASSRYRGPRCGRSDPAARRDGRVGRRLAQSAVQSGSGNCHLRLPSCSFSGRSPAWRKSSLATSWRSLKERVKELTCLQKVRVELQEQASLEQHCERIVEHLAHAMQFQEIASSAIEIDGQSFVSATWSERLSRGLHADIDTAGERRGRLSVFYGKDRHFLPEEQNLVDTIARILGQHLERMRAEEQLVRANPAFVPSPIRPRTQS